MSGHSRSTAIPPRGCSSPAPPASPGRSRRSSSGATRSLELVAVTSRSDAGTRLDSLYPRYRVPLELTELDLDAARGRRRRDRRLPARRLGADGRRRCAGSASLVVDLSADFRLRDLPTYERWYGEHGAPELLDGRRLRAHRALPRAAARGRAGRDARAATRPRASSALAPLAEQGLLADVVIDAKQGVSGAGRGGGDAMHYVSMDENAFAYKTEGHRHRPEIEQELAALGSPAPVTFVPHLLPLDQGELASCYAHDAPSRSPRRRCRRSTRERYAGEPFVQRASTARPACATCATPTSATSTSRSRSGGRVLAFAAIDNLWKGASGQAVQNLNLMLGLDETEGLR